MVDNYGPGDAEVILLIVSWKLWQEVARWSVNIAIVDRAFRLVDVFEACGTKDLKGYMGLGLSQSLCGSIGSDSFLWKLFCSADNASSCVLVSFRRQRF